MNFPSQLGDLLSSDSDENPVPDLSDRDLDLDDFYEILSNERRRWALAYINEFEEYDRDTVATGIAEYEDNKRKSVYTAISQAHEAKLVDGGVLKSNGSREPELEQTGLFSPYIEQEIYDHVRSMA